MANFTARMERIRPPRWVHVRFPRGAMFGEPGNHTKQRQVLADVLQAAAAVAEPAGKIELPYRWEAPPLLWRNRQILEGP